jgi:hypothetical protein
MSIDIFSVFCNLWFSLSHLNCFKTIKNELTQYKNREKTLCILKYTMCVKKNQRQHGDTKKENCFESWN